jgi:hypothetical protein
MSYSVHLICLDYVTCVTYTRRKNFSQFYLIVVIYILRDSFNAFLNNVEATTMCSGAAELLDWPKLKL